MQEPQLRSVADVGGCTRRTDFADPATPKDDGEVAPQVGRERGSGQSSPCTPAIKCELAQRMMIDHHWTPCVCLDMVVLFTGEFVIISVFTRWCEL